MHRKAQIRLKVFQWIFLKNFIQQSYHLLPSSGQTLALAEPEARLYNHPTEPRPPRPEANVCIGYISAISQRIELKFCMIVI